MKEYSLDMEIEDLPYITPTIAKKLKEAGYKTVESIAIASPSEIKAVTGLTETVALFIVRSARKIAIWKNDKTETKARVKRQFTISTGISCMDELFEGGISSGTIVELFGSRGSGKTLICLQIAMRALNDGYEVAYVNTNKSLDLDKVKKFAKNKGISEKIVKRLKVLEAPDLWIQQILIERELHEHTSDILIIDSFTSNFVRVLMKKSAEIYYPINNSCRYEVLEYGDVIGLLNRHLNTLAKLVESNNMIAIITNSLNKKGKPYFNNLIQSTIELCKKRVYWSINIHRVKLSKVGRGNKRIAKIFSSTTLSEKQTLFKIIDEKISCL